MKILDILKDKEKLKQLITYGIFGVLTTCVSLGSFYILKKLFSSINENILNTISIIISIIFAYFTNRKFVFKSKEKDVFKEFIKFCGSRAVSAIFEIVAFFVLNTLVKLDGMLAKAIVSFVVIILNYIMSKLFVFSNKPKIK